MEVLRLGRFEVRPTERMLLIDGAETVIGPRAFDLLLVLIERRGCLIDQDTLLKTVWPRTVEPNNLTVQMSALRKLLGQSSILTVARHGYRFMLKLDSDEGATAGPGRVDSAAAALPPDVGQLPAPAPLYGRDEDAVRVAAGCASAGLVTLCGSSGIGKTKLAMAVARQLMPGFQAAIVRRELRFQIMHIFLSINHFTTGGEISNMSDDGDL